MLLVQQDVPYYFPSLDLYTETVDETWAVIDRGELREGVDIGQDGELIFDVPGESRPVFFVDGVALDYWLAQKRERGQKTYLD